MHSTPGNSLYIGLLHSGAEGKTVMADWLAQPHSITACVTTVSKAAVKCMLTQRSINNGHNYFFRIHPEGGSKGAAPFEITE